MPEKAGAQRGQVRGRSVGRSLVRKVRAATSTQSVGGQPTKAATPVDPSLPRCLVCQSTKLHDEVITSLKKRRTMTAVICDSCRYVSLPANRRDYMAAVTTKNLGGGNAPRMGTWEEPGREYGMAKLALQVLARKDSSVLMYGAGQSIDNHHIAKLPRAGRVAIGDLVPLRDDAECVNTSGLSTDPFDVVIASEVLEHFPDPHPNFENLFSYVKDDGIIIASTNIRDSLPMSKVNYVWPIGHVSYWSPKSLRLIAREFDMHLDFRVPICGTGAAGPRKRYVIFSRSLSVMDSVADWFGSHMYAPSERPDATKHESAQLPPPFAEVT